MIHPVIQPPFAVPPQCTPYFHGYFTAIISNFRPLAGAYPIQYGLIYVDNSNNHANHMSPEYYKGLLKWGIMYSENSSTPTLIT